MFGSDRVAFGVLPLAPLIDDGLRGLALPAALRGVRSPLLRSLPPRYMRSKSSPSMCTFSSGSGIRRFGFLNLAAILSMSFLIFLFKCTLKVLIFFIVRARLVCSIVG